MQAAKDLVYERTLAAKETIRGHPLDPKQAVAIFTAKAIGNFRYLAVVTPWSRRDLERLDRYWRQGFKTAWRLNESTADHPWTTPKNMAGMGYTTTLAVLSHSLHSHVDRCMKIRDVTYQIMQNDLLRVMKDWMCTSKAELTLEAGARSWDEVTDNVWHRLAMCEMHVLVVVQVLEVGEALLGLEFTVALSVLVARVRSCLATGDEVSHRVEVGRLFSFVRREAPTLGLGVVHGRYATTCMYSRQT